MGAHEHGQYVYIDLDCRDLLPCLHRRLNIDRLDIDKFPDHNPTGGSTLDCITLGLGLNHIRLQVLQSNVIQQMTK